MVALFDYLFEKDFLKGITWTGRSAANAPRKIPLKEKIQTLSVVTRLCMVADRSYSTSQCEHDIKYAVLKYAYLGANGTTSSKSKRSKTTPVAPAENNANIVSDVEKDQNLLVVNTNSQPQQNHAIGNRFDAFNLVSFPTNQQGNQYAVQQQNLQYHPYQHQILSLQTDRNGNSVLYNLKEK